MPTAPPDVTLAESCASKRISPTGSGPEKPPPSAPVWLQCSSESKGLWGRSRRQILGRSSFGLRATCSSPAPRQEHPPTRTEGRARPGDRAPAFRTRVHARTQASARGPSRGPQRRTRRWPEQAPASRNWQQTYCLSLSRLRASIASQERPVYARDLAATQSIPSCRVPKAHGGLSLSSASAARLRLWCSPLSPYTQVGANALRCSKVLSFRHRRRRRPETGVEVGRILSPKPQVGRIRSTSCRSNLARLPPTSTASDRVRPISRPGVDSGWEVGARYGPT